jgi:diguanylate cyclase (GGDEF)-like protein/PAS domain S-box-containing protein
METNNILHDLIDLFEFRHGPCRVFLNLGDSEPVSFGNHFEPPAQESLTIDLINRAGAALGSLLVEWPDGNTLTEGRRDAVECLARLVRDHLDIKILEELQISLHDKNAQIALLSEVARQTSNGVVVTDLEGRINWVNDGFQKVTGFSLEEVKGRKPGSFLQGKQTDPETVAHMHERLSEYQDFEVELINYHRNGSPYWVRIHCEPLKLGGDQLSGFMAIQTDIDAEKRSKEKLERFRQTLDSTLDCVFMFDAATLRFFYVNQGALDQLGYSEAELLEMHPYDIKPLFDETEFRELVQPLAERKVPRFNFETVHRRKNGTDVPVEIFLQYIELEGDQPRFVAIVRDITEQKKQTHAIEQLAYFDPLTKLPNRRLIRTKLDHAMASCASTGQFGAVLLSDLDDFKSVNDTLGHRFGDDLLIEIAGRFKRVLPDASDLSRLGGDEFLFILTALGDSTEKAKQKSIAIGQSLVQAAASPTETLGDTKSVSTSLGIVLFDGANIPASELMRMADIAMYDAKRKGKNRLSVFDDAMQHKLIDEHDLTRYLILAINRAGEIVPWFQPKVDQDGRWVGFEALVRWNHPERGLLPPGQFIDIAESQNLMPALGETVLTQACELMSVWRHEYPIQNWTLAVNVSQSQLAMDDFPTKVEQILARTKLPAQMLQLEITESVVAENISGCIAQMNRLRSLGVTFSLDDFGTGYSSLSYLRQLPIDELKIDKSFVETLLHYEEGYSIVKAILQLAGSLKLSVVAEGIEEEAQLVALKALGCKRYQGFLFGRPQDPEEIRDCLATMRIVS